MKQKFATLALLSAAVGAGPSYAGQQPTVANSYVKSVLCTSPQVLTALQPAGQDGWTQTVTIAKFTAESIGDKGLVCNVHAVIKSEKRNGMAWDIREVDRLLLVVVSGKDTIVAEEIDRGFADSLLGSSAVRAIATN